MRPRFQVNWQRGLLLTLCYLTVFLPRDAVIHSSHVGSEQVNSSRASFHPITGVPRNEFNSRSGSDCPGTTHPVAEILINEHLDLSSWTSDPAVQQAYQTACRWYTQYRRLLTSLLGRTALPPDNGPIDYRDYRACAEVLSFVCAHR